MIPTGLWLVAFAAHVPFPEEAGGVAGLLEILREIDRAGRDGSVVVDDTVAEGVEAGEDGGAAGGAQRSGDQRVFQVGTVRGHGIHHGRFRELVAEETHRVEAVVIGENEYDAAGLRAGDVLGQDFLGHGCDGGERRCDEQYVDEGTNGVKGFGGHVKKVSFNKNIIH